MTRHYVGLHITGAEHKALAKNSKEFLKKRGEWTEHQDFSLVRPAKLYYRYSYCDRNIKRA